MTFQSWHLYVDRDNHLELRTWKKVEKDTVSNLEHLWLTLLYYRNICLTARFFSFGANSGKHCQSSDHENWPVSLNICPGDLSRSFVHRSVYHLMNLETLAGALKWDVVVDFTFLVILRAPLDRSLRSARMSASMSNLGNCYCSSRRFGGKLGFIIRRLWVSEDEDRLSLQAFYWRIIYILVVNTALLLSRQEQ